MTRQPPAQENVPRKAVSFATPGAKAAGTKTTGRRAFGDISNRKASVTQQNAAAKAGGVTQTPAVVKPAVRLERKPLATTRAPKSSAKREAVMLEPIEVPYGPTGRQLLELYDSDDDAFSMTSLEKEGGLLTRADREALMRDAAVQHRVAAREHLSLVGKHLAEETLALARRDGTYGPLFHFRNPCICRSRFVSLTSVSLHFACITGEIATAALALEYIEEDSLVHVLNNWDIDFSDGEDDFDLQIPL
jgi:hypothetical protein